MTDLRERPRNVDVQRLAELTVEQRKTLADRTKKIFDGDGQLQQAALILRESRRLYTLGRTALSRRMDELGHGQKEDLEAVIVEAMNKAAMAEFTREDLVDSMQRVVLPFLAFELAAQKSRESAEADREEAAEESARRAQLVPVALPLEGSGVRGETTLFVGPRDTIQTLLTRVADASTQAAGERRVVAIRLLDVLKDHTVISRFEKEVLEIGVNRWAGCAVNIKEMTRFLGGWLRQTFKNRVDLLLIDDLAEMTKAPVDDYPRERMAASALKVVNRWAEENGATVLAGLPATEAPQRRDEFEVFGWRELLNYSRVVLVRQDAGTVYGRSPEETEIVLVSDS